MPPFLFALAFDWRTWALLGVIAGALWLHHDGAESVRREIVAANARADQIQRSEEQRRRTQQQEAKNVHAKEIAEVRADAGRAKSAAERLRQQLEQLAGAAGRDRPAAGGGAPETTVYELFARCGERYSDVARAADEAVAAGRLCERTYDALMPSAQGLRERVRAQLQSVAPAKAGAQSTQPPDSGVKP